MLVFSYVFHSVFSKVTNSMEQKIHKKLTSFFEKPLKYLQKHTFIRCLILSLGVLILCETLSRHSFFDAIAFGFKSPYAFLFNYLIILATMSIAKFFPKEGFALTIMSAFWLILSLINCVVLCFRTTPFSAIDFSIVINMLGIIDIYLNIFQLVLIIIGAIGFIALLVLIYRKSPSIKVDIVRCFAFFICVCVLLAVSGFAGRSTKLLERKLPNLNQAYKDYGFAYCFSLSIFDTGIQQPPEYTFETVDDMLSAINNDTNIPPVDMPNIIYVQLESFFDVNRASNLTLTEDPIPNFTKLKNNYPHGYITVSSIGGGTANTEFEILTGMNLDHFGPGEYPYKTILKQQTCESPAFTLKNYGYTSHAIHNHTATFYDRFQVYPMLGFDTFIPMEMMHGVETNALGWEKDAILTQQIIDCLESTDKQDFIFTVSVQAHGKYPDELLISNTEIELELQNNTAAENKAQYKYYVEQLHETDKFVGELIEKLTEIDEPTVVLFYGDHFPTIYLEEDKLDGTKYQTDYAIWSNYEIYAENKDLMCYQLSAHVFDILGSNLGTITKIHQNANNLTNYQNTLETIEYDMLYGNMLSYGGINPYIPTTMKYGVFDIYITDLVQNNGKLFVYGNKFNEHSKIMIDGKAKDTLYLNPNCLAIELESLDNLETIMIAQYTYDRIQMRTSAEYQITSFTQELPPIDQHPTNETTSETTNEQTEVPETTADTTAQTE